MNVVVLGILKKANGVCLTMGTPGVSVLELKYLLVFSKASAVSHSVVYVPNLRPLSNKRGPLSHQNQISARELDQIITVRENI